MEFQIKGEHIELFKLLKATGLCGTGGEAKIRITEGEVLVDGEPEFRKAAKIRAGQKVSLGDEEIVIQGLSSPAYRPGRRQGEAADE